MRFLNVYPIKLWATSSAPDVFEGKLSFTLEQYGLMFNENDADITLGRDPEKTEVWRLWVKPLHGVDVPYFSRFVDALNHYVFEVLGFVPNQPTTLQEQAIINLFFDGIYFDLSIDPAKVGHVLDLPKTTDNDSAPSGKAS
jgi:hypothetical protein